MSRRVIAVGGIAVDGIAVGGIAVGGIVVGSVAVTLVVPALLVLALSVLARVVLALSVPAPFLAFIVGVVRSISPNGRTGRAQPLHPALDPAKIR